MAWGLLACAWLVANPPFAAPDEADHYIRTVGISEGHLIGRTDPASTVGVTPRQIAWTRQTARSVSVPAGLDPRPYTCQTGGQHGSAACLNAAHPNARAVTLVTAVGNYQPLPYLLPAVTVRLGSSPPAALRLARAAGALLALALYAVALFALYDASYPGLSLAGVLLAVTPMAIFCAASVNGSGLEIASSVAFVACLLKTIREPGARVWWIAAGTTGAIVALSRPASPVWLLLDMLAVGGWAATRETFAQVVRKGVRWLAVPLLVAIAVNRVWESMYGSHVAIETSSLHAGLVAGVHQWWRALPELVGKFGYLNVKLPLVLPLLWLAPLLGLFVAARHLRRGEWSLIVLLLAASLVLPPVFYALFTRPTGFGLQGRQLLPVFVVLPLLVGELAFSYRMRIGRATRRALITAICFGVAIVQAGAWLVNAHRFAVGPSGPTWFPAHATWNPPLGWTAWVVLILVACATLALQAVHTAGVPDFATEQA